MKVFNKIVWMVKKNIINKLKDQRSKIKRSRDQINKQNFDSIGKQ
jgi:hypothetical protein